MLMVILNRLKPQAKAPVVEGAPKIRFSTQESSMRSNPSTNKVCTMYLLTMKRAAFGRVWYGVLWAAMKRYNIVPKLTNCVQQLHEKSSSAVSFG